MEIGLFAVLIISLLTVYFLFWVEVFHDPRYLEVERKLLDEFVSQGKKHLRYEVVYVIRSLNEIMRMCIHNERTFFRFVAILIAGAFVIMIFGVINHFGIISVEVKADVLKKLFFHR